MTVFCDNRNSFNISDANKSEELQDFGTQMEIFLLPKNNNLQKSMLQSKTKKVLKMQNERQTSSISSFTAVSQTGR